MMEHFQERLSVRSVSKTWKHENYKHKHKNISHLCKSKRYIQNYTSSSKNETSVWKNKQNITHKHHMKWPSQQQQLTAVLHLKHFTISMFVTIRARCNNTVFVSDMSFGSCCKYEHKSNGETNLFILSSQLRMTWTKYSKQHCRNCPYCLWCACGHSTSSTLQTISCLAKRRGSIVCVLRHLRPLPSSGSVFTKHLNFPRLLTVTKAPHWEFSLQTCWEQLYWGTGRNPTLRERAESTLLLWMTSYFMKLWLAVLGLCQRIQHRNTVGGLLPNNPK